MPALPDLQRAFLRAIVDDDPGAIAGELRPGALPAARRIRIHHNNVAATLDAALSAVHPVVARLVGDGFFAYLADAYRRRHPAESGDLNDHGRHLACFIEGFEPADGVPYLADVARLEWAVHTALRAAPAAVLDVDRLARIPADRHAALRLCLHPSARLLASRYPVVRIWEANSAPGAAADESIDLAAGGERALVHRPENAIAVARLGEGEHALLAALERGEVLGDACVAALAADPGLDLGKYVHELARRGVVTGFEAGPD